MIMMMMIISMTPTLQIIPKERAFKGPHVGSLFSRALAGGEGKRPGNEVGM